MTKNSLVNNKNSNQEYNKVIPNSANNLTAHHIRLSDTLREREIEKKLNQIGESPKISMSLSLKNKRNNSYGNQLDQEFGIVKNKESSATRNVIHQNLDYLQKIPSKIDCWMSVDNINRRTKKRLKRNSHSITPVETQKCWIKISSTSNPLQNEITNATEAQRSYTNNHSRRNDKIDEDDEVNYQPIEDHDPMLRTHNPPNPLKVNKNGKVRRNRNMRVNKNNPVNYKEMYIGGNNSMSKDDSEPKIDVTINALTISNNPS